MHIEKSVALPEHAKPAWLVAPATGEVFEGKDDRYRYLQGLGSFEGFVWKDGTARWEFKCKLHDTRTLNTRGLELRKLKDKESKTVTNS